MSNVLQLAEEAWRRWRSSHADSPVPPVRIFHDGGEIGLNGLVVQPSANDDFVAFGSATHELPIHVLRAVDIQRVVIGDPDPDRFGFGPSD